MSLRILQISAVAAFLAITNVVHANPIVAWDEADGGNGHTYEMVEQVVSWTDANAYAQTLTFDGMPGYLVSITSQAEQNFVISNFMGYGAHSAWIGLTADPAYGGGGDIGTAGPGAPYWVWTSGEPVSYTNWLHAGDGYPYNEPNNLGGQEAYGEMALDDLPLQPGGWNDLANNDIGGIIMYSIVEFNTQIVPEPSTLALAAFGGLTLLAYRQRRRSSSRR